MAQPQKTRVAVLYGGRSSERSVSLKTGSAVGKALADAGYRVTLIDTRDVDPRTLDPADVDVVFIALHGEFGEDGGVQQILDGLGMPYTGSGVRASRAAMDKLQTKAHFERSRVPTPPWVAIHRHWPVPLQLATAGSFGFPVIVKPAREGSSVGVHLVRRQADLADALADAFAHGTCALAEVFLPGRELTVGILGDRALPIIQLNYKGDLFDYHNKYTPGATEHVIDPRLPPGVAEKATSISLAAHRSLGCRGITRVDLRLDAHDRPFVLEVNTIPGMTETSLIPDAARAAGVSFTRVCELAIDLALARAMQPVGV